MAGLAAIRRLGSLLICVALLAGAWMLLVDTKSVAEYCACAAAAVLGTLATALVEHENIARLSEHHVFAAALPTQLARVPAWRRAASTSSSTHS